MMKLRVSIKRFGTRISNDKIKQHPGYIDYKNAHYPEANPMSLRVYSQMQGRYIWLANYRYPAVDQKNRKGIIYFVHGYGEYVGRYAYFAKYFAEAGYDVMGIDWRNFGHSQGDEKY